MLRESRGTETPKKAGDPYGTRTRVFAVRGRRPRPLDEGAACAAATAHMGRGAPLSSRAAGRAKRGGRGGPPRSGLFLVALGRRFGGRVGCGLGRCGGRLVAGGGGSVGGGCGIVDRVGGILGRLGGVLGRVGGIFGGVGGGVDRVGGVSVGGRGCSRRARPERPLRGWWRDPSSFFLRCFKKTGLLSRARGAKEGGHARPCRCSPAQRPGACRFIARGSCA